MKEKTAHNENNQSNLHIAHLKVREERREYVITIMEEFILLYDCTKIKFNVNC